MLQEQQLLHLHNVSQILVLFIGFGNKNHFILLGRKGYNILCSKNLVNQNLSTHFTEINVCDVTALVSGEINKTKSHIALLHYSKQVVWTQK